ncbi:MAG: radical SAM protein, partial [Anaerolineae bacterium]|nr:radical SAM protein [Anaerolineae bacterium]
SVTCLWVACDPYTTRSVWGVEGNAQATNCGRENKDGVDFSKSDTEGYERYLALYHTPHEYGGCQGCRFFLMCKGNCPGTALDGDWRNRSQDCPVWYPLLEHLEAEMLADGRAPISRHPQREQIEAMFLEAWASGQNTSMAHCLTRLSHDGRAGSGPPGAPGNRPHGDSPHRDHTDAIRR